MIVGGQPLSVLIRAQPVDLRCGHQALALIVQTQLKLDPYSGLAVVFRSKRGDRLKILVWDGTGIILMLEGLDWRRTVARRMRPPSAAG